jgi:hypothetical protein
MTRRTPKALVGLAWTPHACVVLGIDPGKVAGWALLAEGKRVASGIACSAEDRTEVVARARAVAFQWGLPLVAVGERWTAGGWMSFASQAGLHVNWGVWREALELAGHPKRRIVRVEPREWRASTVGHHKGTEAYKQAAVERARDVHHVRVQTADEAEAIAIAEWGSRAQRVLDVIPKARGAIQGAGGAKKRAPSSPPPARRRRDISNPTGVR